MKIFEPISILKSRYIAALCVSAKCTKHLWYLRVFICHHKGILESTLYIFPCILLGYLFSRRKGVRNTTRSIRYCLVALRLWTGGRNISP